VNLIEYIDYIKVARRRKAGGHAPVGQFVVVRRRWSAAGPP